MAAQITVAATPAATNASLRAVRRIVAATLALERQNYSAVSVALVDLPTIQKLNRRFRGKNRPTNVLSFSGPPEIFQEKNKKRDLGEIVVCAAFAAKEAQKVDMAAEIRLAHLLIHGTLHLLGHDHETSLAGQKKMEALETKLLDRLPADWFKALRPLLPADSHRSQPSKTKVGRRGRRPRA